MADAFGFDMRRCFLGFYQTTSVETPAPTTSILPVSIAFGVFCSKGSVMRLWSVGLLLRVADDVALLLTPARSCVLLSS